MKPLKACFLLLFTFASAQAEVRINEFMASTSESLQGPEGEAHDWIELYNAGDLAVNLEGYYLTDDEDFSATEENTFWRFPSASIAPDTYLLVLASGQEDEPGSEFLHASFQLNREGERLALILPDGVTVVDELALFPEQQSNVSYGVTADTQWQYLPSPTPGEPNTAGIDGFVGKVSFSVERGFFETPFTVDLASDTEDAQIIYTTDGQTPSLGTIFTGVVGKVYEGPIEISETTVLRAIAFKTGRQPSVNRGQTYIFLDDILHQAARPEGFPAKWGSRTPDYEMDPEIVGGTYSEQEVKDALLGLPTISLVTDNDNLFASDGIYTNSQAKDLANDGIEDKWERPASVELMGFPHGQTIQANCGIRMQGNASRSPNRQKHNMRVIFRSEYGPGKLRFRLFEDSEVDTFNSINLRSNNGDSWINPGVRTRAQYIRDQWHRVVQREMRQPNQSQIYAHVYINGLYWGLYHVFERFEASLLSEHWGGDESDWDALQDTPAFQDIVVNGDDKAYRLTHDLVKEDLTIPENYEKVLEYVDVDNLIDYLLLNFYSGNQDWDHKNMRYARRRTPAENGVGNGWIFFAWDSERAGLNGLSSQTLTMDNTNQTRPLGPRLLNSEMHANPDYHLRFSDRLVKHCFNGGPLTPEGVSRSWNELAQSVYQGLIGESARWGDLHVSKPETREGNWQTALDKENTVWIPERTGVLLEQLSKSGFSAKKPSFPQFEPFGGVVEAGAEVPIRIFNDTIFNPISGDIYYTMDGTDPRLPDGSLDPKAIPYDPTAKPVITQSLTMMGRVYDDGDGQWSPLGEAYFHLGALPTAANLAVSEIGYDPSEASDDEQSAGYATGEFEFIELQNVGDVPLDLSGVQITNGVRVLIDATQKPVVAPGGYALVVANRDAFNFRYPNIDASLIVGTFTGDSRLSNGGERLTIRDHTGLLIHSFEYDNKAPWPSIDDDAGGTLVLVDDASASIANPNAWSASAAPEGTPGSAGVGSGGESETTLSSWLNEQGLTGAEEKVGPGKHAALLFYALGIDSWNQADAPIRPSVDQAQLSYQRRTGIRDMDWIVESSADLKAWQTAALQETRVSKVSEQAERVDLDIPITNSSATYWRVRVQTK